MRTTLATLVLTMPLAMAGCASVSDKDVATPAAAPAPAPAKQPFVAPDWESTEWKSTELGVSVHYPVVFTEQPLQPGGLLTAASPNQVPRIDLSATPLPADRSLDGFASAIETNMATIGGGKAKVTARKEVKLADGVTDAMELVVAWSFQGFPLESVVLESTKGDQLIALQVTGLEGGDLEALRGIAYTLYFH